MAKRTALAFTAILLAFTAILLAFTAILPAFTAILLAFSCHVAAAKQPNFLLILLDDAGWTDVGCFGGRIQTPNIDHHQS